MRERKRERERERDTLLGYSCVGIVVPSGQISMRGVLLNYISIFTQPN